MTLCRHCMQFAYFIGYHPTRQKRRVMRLIENFVLSSSLDTLANLRIISHLSILNKYYHCVCSDEIKIKISPKASFFRHSTLLSDQIGYKSNKRIRQLVNPYPILLDQRFPTWGPRSALGDRKTVPVGS